MSGAPPRTIAIKSCLNQRTLVVGNEQSVASNFPKLAEELLSCKDLQICGELDRERPVDDLWRRIQETQPERL